MLSRKELLKRAKKVRLLAMDVDGVLTDGSILVLESGEEVKVWNAKDRIAFSMLEKAGGKFHTAWITGRESRQVQARADELRIGALRQSCLDKGRALIEIARRFGVSPAEALYIGDDVVDLSAFRVAGLAVSPADGHASVKKAAHYVSKFPGGRGVFREAVDLVLEAQGLLDAVEEGFANPPPASGRRV